MCGEGHEKLLPLLSLHEAPTRTTRKSHHGGEELLLNERRRAVFQSR